MRERSLALIRNHTEMQPMNALETIKARVTLATLPASNGRPCPRCKLSLSKIEWDTGSQLVCGSCGYEGFKCERIIRH